jgi:hypothetical protein
VSASATGGAGGALDLGAIDSHGLVDGQYGQPGAGVRLINAVSGSTTGSLFLTQSATGGAGGEGLCASGCEGGGAGETLGDADSTTNNGPPNP